MKKGEAKTGGRQKGTPNKRTSAIEAMLKRKGCDPLEFLADVVVGKTKVPLTHITSKTGKLVTIKGLPTLDQRLSAARELAQYIAPKRKAIEIGDPDNVLEILIKTAKGEK